MPQLEFAPSGHNGRERLDSNYTAMSQDSTARPKEEPSTPGYPIIESHGSGHDGLHRSLSYDSRHHDGVHFVSTLVSGEDEETTRPRKSNTGDRKKTFQFWQKDQAGLQMFHEPTLGGTDQVEFGCPVYYCSEDEDHVDVEVVRYGHAQTACSVCYSTQDGSACAGKKYLPVSGELNFGPGETRKVISIQIIQNETFDATLEFEVKLGNPVAARLGSYLHSSRVMICDDDAFPTNKFKEFLMTRQFARIPKWPLLIEYLKFHVMNHTVRWYTVLNVLSDQLSNLTFAYLVILTNYLIDDVLRPVETDPPRENSQSVIWAVAGFSVLPQALLWLSDRQKLLRRVRGMAIAQLQENLLRKFMYYDEGSRILVSNSDLTMAITRDVPDLIDNGFLTFLTMMRNLGLLLVYSILAMKQMANMSWIFLCILFGVYPIIVISFLRLRHYGTLSRRQCVFHSQTEVVGLVQQSTECFRLIADYDQRHMIVRLFAGKVQAANAAWTQCAVWENSSKHFVPFLNSLLVGLFIGLVGVDVLDDQKEVLIGEFITGMAICKGIGNCYKELYEDMLQMLAALAPLQNVVFYMNLPADVLKRMELSRRLLDEGKQYGKLMPTSSSPYVNTNSAGLVSTMRPVESVASSQKIESSMNGEGSMTSLVGVVDNLEIRAKDLSFAYSLATGGGKKIFDKASFSIPQGKMVCVTGPKGSGKATLLELISGVILPPLKSMGALFRPPHLRVLHVSFDPIIFSDFDIMDNICFGPSDGRDEDPNRVVKICRRLGISEGLIKTLERKVSEGAPRYDSQLSEKAFGKLGAGNRDDRGLRSDLRVDGTIGDQVGGPDSVARRMHAEAEAQISQLLSYTDKCLVHLARALVMNPEVLILHKPLGHFDDFLAWRVLDLFREYVEFRGIEQDEKEHYLRRPRSCIFSAHKSKETEKADVVYHVDKAQVKAVDTSAYEKLKRTARQLFEQMDVDSDNKVQREEFVKCIKTTPWALRLLGISKEKMQSPADAIPILNRVFNALDRDGSGCVDCEELTDFIRSFVDQKLIETLETLEETTWGNAWDAPVVPQEELLKHAISACVQGEPGLPKRKST